MDTEAELIKLDKRVSRNFGNDHTPVEEVKRPVEAPPITINLEEVKEVNEEVKLETISNTHSNEPTERT